MTYVVISLDLTIKGKYLIVSSTKLANYWFFDGKHVHYNSFGLVQNTIKRDNFF